MARRIDLFVQPARQWLSETEHQNPLATLGQFFRDGNSKNRFARARSPDHQNRFVLQQPLHHLELQVIKPDPFILIQSGPQPEVHLRMPGLAPKIVDRLEPLRRYPDGRALSIV